MPIKFDTGKKLWIKNDPCESPFGWVSEMEEYLGAYVTITKKFDAEVFAPYAETTSDGYFIKEDGESYVWDENMFCEENPSAETKEDVVSLDDFLGGFNLV